MGMVLFVLIVTIIMIGVISKVDKLEKEQKAIDQEVQYIKNVRVRFMVQDIKNISEELMEQGRDIDKLGDKLYYLEEKFEYHLDNDKKEENAEGKET